jgi:hypothetical protein
MAAGEVDGHVLNVLYGSQEAAGIDRLFNTHFFVYTKAVARALAEQAGYVDVTVEDWQDREELSYHLYIRGRKPSPDEGPAAGADAGAAHPPEGVPATEPRADDQLAPAAVDAAVESAVTGGAG